MVGKSSEFYRRPVTETKYLWKLTREGKHLSRACPSIFQEVAILGPGRGTVIFIWKPLRTILLYFPFLSSQITAAIFFLFFFFLAIFFYHQLFIVFFSQNLGQKETGQKAKHFFQKPRYFVALFQTIRYNCKTHTHKKKRKRKKKTPKLVQLFPPPCGLFYLKKWKPNKHSPPVPRMVVDRNAPQILSFLFRNEHARERKTLSIMKVA